LEYANSFQPDVAMPQCLDISSSDSDLRLLANVYHDLFVSEFPDANERESLENMIDYLRQRSAGWYGKNNYHILMVLDDGEPCGMAISDYLAEPNTGVIEFLAVSRRARARGHGRFLLDATEERLSKDALSASKAQLDYIVAEMNDPFRPGSLDDAYDPFVRAEVWAKWRYARLDFPYLQPALSPRQQPVTNLMLIGKSFGLGDAESVSSELTKTILREYMRWAMRIEEPDTSPEYLQMAAFLSQRPAIRLSSLSRYVGKDPHQPLTIEAVTEPDQPDLQGVLRVYEAAFPSGPANLEADGIRQMLARHLSVIPDERYHLWAARATPSSPVEGCASFFAFPDFGFGGYVALSGSLRGKKYLRSIIALLEQRMLRDFPRSRGWYIECAPATAPVFAKLGFDSIALPYRPPRLDHASDAREMPPLILMYKEFGRRFAAPALATADLLEAVALIFERVYGLAKAECSSAVAELASAARRSGSEFAPFAK